MIADNTTGTKRPDGKIFAQSPELWAAVRAHAAPGARVANNPALPERRDALAGQHVLGPARQPLVRVLPAPISRSPSRRCRRTAARRLTRSSLRVFDGNGSADDVKATSPATYGCEIVVVVPQDGAWNNDPFAASPDYRAGRSPRRTLADLCSAWPTQPVRREVASETREPIEALLAPERLGEGVASPRSP